LWNYCEKWKLVVNVNKTNGMVFRKLGRLKRELRFYYNHNAVEIVSQFTYLGIAFTAGGLLNKHLIFTWTVFEKYI